MVETLFSPEVMARYAPVHIILGPHEDDDIHFLGYLDRAIDERLRAKKTGKVGVFFEDASASEDEAELIEGKMAQGTFPSVCSRIAFFRSWQHRLPNLEDKKDCELLQSTTSFMPKFDLKRFAILDKHFESGRLRLLYESTPNEDLAQDNAGQAYDFNLGNVYLYAINGNFDKGLELFKRTIEDAASSDSRRDERFALKIANIAQENDVVDVVGYIGACHTRLGHLLSKKGLVVTRTFADMEDNLIVWSHAEEACRRRELFPYKKLSELDWYRLMVGFVVKQHIIDTVGREHIGVSDQKIIKKGRHIFSEAHLTDMISIKKFESDVRDKGFKVALNKRIKRI